MDYRVFAVDELSKLNQNYASVKIIKDRIAEIEEKLKSSGGGSGGAVPNGGGGNKTEQKWLSLIASKDDEKRRLEGVIRSIRRVEAALKAIPEIEAKILRKAYADGRHMEDIAREEHMSNRTVYRVRREAIIKFTRVYFGTVVT
ncbi:MAG: DUF1492 domain-containing protein [Ruminococcaceae bacterium]|nr:DUF1492 domain-containing protein [Oscillospiraceae bacterium]